MPPRSEGEHQHHSDQPVIAESLFVDPSLGPDIFGDNTFPFMTNSDWCNAQNNDPSISCVITFVRRAIKPSLRETNLEHPDVKPLLREWKKLELRNDVVYSSGRGHCRECMMMLAILVLSVHFT